MDDKTVWQPTALYQPGYEFGILLDPDLALRMLSTELDSRTKENLKKLGLETIVRMGYNYPEPYLFYGNSWLVQEFDIGNNGKWLSLDSSQRLDNIRIPLKYSSHNVDTSKEAYALMALVDRWVEYFNLL
jgi:hypothetical protein